MSKFNKEMYNRNNPPPIGNDQEAWADYCDWINREGDYANLNPDKLSFPKNFYFITRYETSSNIETLKDGEI